MATPENSRIDADALASLEERILRAVQMITQLRQEKETAETIADSYAAEKEAASADKQTAEAALAELKQENQRLNDELENLRTDRKQVRTRIEKLLGQLDTLGT